VPALKVEWFESEGSIPAKEISLINDWLDKNAEAIHDIYHLVQEYEMEVVKIIDGNQETESDGRIRITSYDLYFVIDAILVVKSEEIQYPDRLESSRSLRYLAKVEIPCDEPGDEE